MLGWHPCLPAPHANTQRHCLHAFSGINICYIAQCRYKLISCVLARWLLLLSIGTSVLADAEVGICRSVSTGELVCAVGIELDRSAKYASTK